MNNIATDDKYCELVMSIDYLDILTKMINLGELKIKYIKLIIWGLGGMSTYNLEDCDVRQIINHVKKIIRVKDRSIVEDGLYGISGLLEK